MALGVDDSAVALAANDGAYGLHLGGDVNLTHCSSVVLAAMTLGNVAQSARGTEVGDGASLHMIEHIVGHTHKGVLLTKHLSVLLDERQTVHIGVNDHSKVITTLGHLAHNTAEVLLQRLGIVGEVAVGLAIEEGVAHPETVEELGKYDAPNGVDGVDDHTEMAVADGLHIHQIEREDGVDVARIEAVVLAVAAQMVHIGIVECLLGSDVEHGIAVVLGEELALMVEQLEGIPLTGVVAGGDDDATCRLTHADGKLGSGGSGKSDVEHIVAHPHQSAADYVAHHVARDARIASYDDVVTVRVAMLTDKLGIRRGELHNVQRVEGVAGLASDCAPDARDGFYKCHIFI